jgi:hypothetical protein
MDPDADQNGLVPADPDTATSTPPSGTGGSGIDFTQFHPSNEGLQQLDIWKVIANILLYVGFGGAFLAFLLGLIMWVIGHKVGGRHVLDEGKTTILRAIGVGMILGSAGGIWTWVVNQ